MIMAMHQPNYIPWLGYFYKMYKSDVFVLLDVVQFPRGQSFAARNRIKTAQGAVYLTVPVSIPKNRQGKALYTEVQFANQKWKKKHLKTIELSYKRAPYFEEVFPWLEAEILKAETLIDLNIGLILKIKEFLQIKTRLVLLSEILKSFGQKTQLIIDICKALQCDTYLSGTGGGKEYNDETLLNQHGISLIYSNFKHPTYQQLWGAFIPNLSIIDLLFNHGAQSREILVSSR